MRKLSIHGFTALLVLCILVTIPVLSFAADSPTDRIRTTTDKVLGVLNNPALKGPAKEAQRRKEIRAAVFGVFDFKEMAKRSLAQYWKERTPQEQEEFVSLFADLLERSYINKIENYSGEKIVYGAETKDQDYAVVKSKFITKRREEIPVDYRMLTESGQWWVYDVVIENVSLVNNYRVQFNKIIRGSSYADLVKKMKNKAESEGLVAVGAGTKK